MIKFDSIVLTKNKKQDNKILSFSLDNKKINFVYSKNKENIENILSLVMGYFKPYLGNLIYQDIYFLKQSYSNRNAFVNNNICFCFGQNGYQTKQTIYEYLIENFYAMGCENKKIENLIETKLNEYELSLQKNEFIYKLNLKQKIDLQILLASIKQSKYLFFYNINELFINDEIENYFLAQIKNKIPKDTLICLLSNKNNLNLKKTKKYFNFVDLDEDKNNTSFFITEKEVKYKVKANIFYKKEHYFYFLNKLMKSNVLINLLWFFILNILTNMLVLFLSDFPYLRNLTTQAEPKNIASIGFVLQSFVHASHILLALLISYIATENDKTILFNWTRKGLDLKRFFLVKIIQISLIYFINIIVLIIIQLMLQISFQIQYNYVACFVSLFFIYLAYIIFYVLMVLLRNKNMIKFDNEFI